MKNSLKKKPLFVDNKPRITGNNFSFLAGGCDVAHKRVISFKSGQQSILRSDDAEAR